MCDEGKSKILDVKILCQNEDTNQFEITKLNDKYARIDFDYADPKDGIVIQIMHTGEAQNVKIGCKIKGGRKVKILNEAKKTYNNKLLMNFFAIMMVILSISMLFLMIASVYICMINIEKNFWENIISAIFSSGCALLVDGIYFKFLKEMYHIEIPGSLRKAIGNEEFYR